MAQLPTQQLCSMAESIEPSQFSLLYELHPYSLCFRCFFSFSDVEATNSCSYLNNSTCFGPFLLAFSEKCYPAIPINFIKSSSSTSISWFLLIFVHPIVSYLYKRRMFLLDASPIATLSTLSTLSTLQAEARRLQRVRWGRWGNHWSADVGYRYNHGYI